MTTRNKNIIIASSLVGGIILYILVNKHIKNKEIEKILSIVDGTTTAPGQNAIPKSEYDLLLEGNFPLKLADKNKKVYVLQQNMNTKYGSNLDLDGKFGQGLYNALCENYWWKPCLPGVYIYDIEQSDFDEIKKK